MADEVETLRRELEAIKLQLEQERRKNAANGGDSPLKQFNKPKRDGATRRDESPKPKQRESDTKKKKKVTPEPRIYVKHAAVGGRRGKWWLRDRQVLSRAPPGEGGVATLKVRETWVWSGRTVILDKLVRVEAEGSSKEEAEEVADLKPELEEEVSTSIVEVAVAPEQPSEEQPSEAETNVAVSTDGMDAVVDDTKAAEATKADDEVRESSATVVDPVRPE